MGKNDVNIFFDLSVEISEKVLALIEFPKELPY